MSSAGFVGYCRRAHSANRVSHALGSTPPGSSRSFSITVRSAAGLPLFRAQKQNPWSSLTRGFGSCKLWRVLSCEARGHACIGATFAPHAARRRSRSVPRHPHVQTGFRRGLVPRPFVLPSAFAFRCRSRHRRPGGAAVRAASAPANAATAADRARSRQDACTWEGSAKCSADALALHARRHAESHWIDTTDGTMRCTAACSESAAIMGVPPATPDARRRSRRMR